MTTTPHGQVPEALIDLIDAYAETRHRYGRIHNARTEAARNAVIEALSGVQALSAAPEAIAKLRHLYQNMVNGAVRDTASAKRIAEGLLAPAIEALERATPPAEQQAQAGAVPQGWKAVPVNPTPEMWKAAKTVPDPNPPYPPHYGLVWDAMFAASPTPPAEQQAEPGAVDRTGCTAGTDEECTRRGCATSCPAQQAAPKAAPVVGNSVFDRQTAADFLSGKTVSDEAVRKFVATSRRAHDERAALSAKLLAMHGVLTSREAEIALLKKALLEAEAAPQQEAQEPCGWTTGITWRPDTRLQSEQVIKITRDTQPKYGYTTPIYTAPQPAPLSDDVAKDAALWHWLAEYLVGTRTDLDDEIVASKTVNDLRKLVEAAIKQGGKA